MLDGIRYVRVVGWFGMNGIDEMNRMDGMNGMVGMNVVDEMNGVVGMNVVEIYGMYGMVGMNMIDGINRMDGMNGTVGTYRVLGDLGKTFVLHAKHRRSLNIFFFRRQFLFHFPPASIYI